MDAASIEPPPILPSSSDQRQFGLLLSPCRVGTTTWRNRVLMGSMHTRFEHASDSIPRQVAFYRARAKGGVAAIVTGGFSPNSAGALEAGAPVLDTIEKGMELRPVVAAVHDEGAQILLQILHAGRYAKHAGAVGPSDIRSPISRFAPRPLDSDEIEATIRDFVLCANYARDAGFDGVEVMGSEGYLINQFAVMRTNNRSDTWGGSANCRQRFPTEIVRRIRESLGPDFVIMYRISAIDLVEGGNTGAEVDALALAIQKSGADVLSTGIGWHEARIPTIAAMVPRGAFTFAAARLKKIVQIPVVASNRINGPELAERVIAEGHADIISLARPMLADPFFVSKAASGRAKTINRCIACNQACLDNIFTNRIAACMVNPASGHEVELNHTVISRRKRIAVVGGGAAGLSCAVTAAERGHHVTIWEKDSEIGGQLRLAAQVPGKSEFNELISYFSEKIREQKVEVRLAQKATFQCLSEERFDHIVLASGVLPRIPAINGIDHPKVASYTDILSGRVQAGERVVILGAGGIGFDVAHFLSAKPQSMDDFRSYWGIDHTIVNRGGLMPQIDVPPSRQITVLQRSCIRPGRTLGISSGWILKIALQRAGVQFLTGCSYYKIDDQGIHIGRDGITTIVSADTIVICAGQESHKSLAAEMSPLGIPISVIGGAALASELDATRAIQEGHRLALTL